MNKIFERGPMTAHITDGGRRSAGVLVVSGAAQVRRRIAQVGGEQAIMFNDYGTFRTGQFHTPWIAGKCGRGREKRSERAVAEFQRSDQRVFGVDFVQSSLAHGLDSRYIAEEPEQKIGGVDRLVDQSAAAVEFERAAPMGIRVITRR